MVLQHPVLAHLLPHGGQELLHVEGGARLLLVTNDNHNAVRLQRAISDRLKRPGCSKS